VRAGCLWWRGIVLGLVVGISRVRVGGSGVADEVGVQAGVVGLSNVEDPGRKLGRSLTAGLEPVVTATLKVAALETNRVNFMVTH
jgi:hypothetical protein